ncbi:keratin, type II cytoskeletal 1 [Brachypodium distachyon]|uniref:Uncharacterized protein n=1 Tax=Brachypodium distachyon TaxID=15368 RepID=I1I373_BRADI|nr:keratin, type II cytoskeletal 1 [Brachypodium distachyon]KQJ96250.1 hypothetical protein BRADI_3g21944v3 [Brachypodium distachyon]|eukprot:XP_003573777.1 keratin, type II cytoskeletal 1 [Brachypodium distachyon]
MASLPQRFKLLATRCAAGAPSPSRSPAPSYSSASPGYRLRRRRGASSRRRGGGRLRRFLCRRVGGGPEPTEEDKKPLVGRGGRTLRDLFVASPEAGRRRRGGCGCDDEDGEGDGVEEGAIGSVRAGIAHGHGGGGGGGRRFGSGGLRSLLMRRSWRPVLVAIPESEGKIELGAIEE